MDYTNLKLENQLCFTLYTASRSIIGLYTPFLDQLGITYTQYITLMVLWEHGEITLKELSKKLYLDSGTLTPLLKKLEMSGYVIRKRDLEDERILRVKITEAGLDLRQAASHIPSQVFQKTTLDIQEAKSIKNQLDSLIATINSL